MSKETNNSESDLRDQLDSALSEIELLKRVIAEENSAKYAAYIKITSLQEELKKYTNKN